MSPAFTVIVAIGMCLAIDSTAQPHMDPAVSLPAREACDRADFQKVLAPSAQGDAKREARAVWLNRQLIKWPGAHQSGAIRLYFSAIAEIEATPGRIVRGADGWLALETFTGEVPAEIAKRFKYVADGRVLALRDTDFKGLRDLHQRQLVLVSEDAAGNVIDSAALQSAGALDDMFAAAAGTDDLGVTV